MLKIRTQITTIFTFIKTNKNESLILFIWLILWFGLGTRLNETFDLKNYYPFPNLNFLRSNLIFYISVILIFYFIFLRFFSEYIILLLYPLLSFAGYLKYSNEGFYFGFHYFISFISIVLFINFISSSKINKKLVFNILDYTTLLILGAFFLIFIAPDFIKTILGHEHGMRGEVIFDIFFSDTFSFHIPQNSNGASRILVVILLLIISYYSFLLKNKFTLKTGAVLFLAIILATINTYYQSKLNILFFILACLFIFLFDIKITKKKIFSLLLLIFFPFILSESYNNLNSIDKRGIVENNRILSADEGLSIFLDKESPLLWSKTKKKKKNLQIISDSSRLEEIELINFNFKNKAVKIIGSDRIKAMSMVEIMELTSSNEKLASELLALKEEYNKSKNAIKLKYNRTYRIDDYQNIYRDKNGFYFLIFKDGVGTNTYAPLNLFGHGDLQFICETSGTMMDRFLGGRICGWELAIKTYLNNSDILGFGFFEDQYLLRQFQKISSNSFIFALYNGGIISLIVLIIFNLIILKKLLLLYKTFPRINSNLSIKFKFYFMLTFYLLVRGFFEDTLAYISIDTLLLITCISFLNYFLDNSKNLLINSR